MPSITADINNDQSTTGATGPTGANQGIIGDTGPTGNTEPVGMIGPTGDIGLIGNTGPTGDIGPIGNIGPTGDIGPIGYISPTGNIGPAGNIGPTGDIGPAGNIGPTGAIGLMGLAGSTGATGPPGPAPSSVTLIGVISGPSDNNTITAGQITNIMLADNITDTKLNTITSTGKVSNSATTATASANNDTIVLRGTTTSLKNMSTASIDMNQANENGNTYNSLYVNRGNSVGALYGAFTPLGDEVHLSYNNYHINNSNTLTILRVGGGTSRISLLYGKVCLGAGPINTAPTYTLSVTPTLIRAINKAVFQGILDGNAATATSFSGNLAGNINGPMNATVIGAGVVTNAMLAGNISDTKLNTIATAGKVSNSATTATNSANPSTIVLRDINSATNMGNIYCGSVDLKGFINNSGNTYNSLYANGGNSVGALYGTFTPLGDGMHLSYNNYHINNSNTLTIPTAAGGTSRNFINFDF